MYGATCLEDCLVKVTPASRVGNAYNLFHAPSGEWGTLWWETETRKPCWLLVTSEDGGYWSQQFFMKQKELPKVINILFQEGWTWKR